MRTTLDLARGSRHVELDAGGRVVRVTVRQLFVLRAVSRVPSGEGFSIRGCARRLRVCEQTARHAVVRLAQLGLVTVRARRMPNGGQLENACELTAAGLAALESANRYRLAWKEERDA